MKYKKIICCLLLMLTLSGCSGTASLNAGAQKQKIEIQELTDDFKKNQMQFAVNLFQETALQNPDGNLLISPLSVMTALSMTANGAKNQTLSEIEQVLGSDISDLNQNLYSYLQTLPSSGKTKFSIANSIWFRDTEALKVNPEFIQNNVNYYDCDLYQEAFTPETCDKINQWVDKNTDHQINHVIDHMNPEDMLYLINALSFDGKWLEPYEKDKIEKQRFENFDHQGTTVSMMKSEEIYYISSDHAEGFLKPYQDGYSFAAILPDEEISVNEYIASLDSETLSDMLNHPDTNAEIIAGIPKFSSDFNISAKEILFEMGIQTAFTDDADFSDMAEYQNQKDALKIGEVLHKTHIEVDEQGTKASAVTAVIMMNKAEAMQKSVILNRPFVYLIIDDANKLPVFIGTVREIRD
ncbi:MAG: serpin family protein [Oscillospiraceae bacterium]|nr:serpin family protein [Oscillospiraceae bacterium]